MISRLPHAVCALVMVVAAGLQASQLSPVMTPQARMIEVERLTSEGEWGRASDLLTEVINELSAGERSEETDRMLLLAYERRAMARLQTGDEANARLDFAALLQVNPNHTIASASPGVASFFADVRKSVLGLLDLSIRPTDSTVTLERLDAANPADAAARTISNGQFWVRPGQYHVTVRRPGHDTATHAFSAAPGTTERRGIALPRTSVALFVSTTPAGVRVLVDGEVRGVTQGAATGGASAMLVIDGLAPRDTAYKIRFEKECFVPAGETFLVESLDVPVGTGGPDPNKVALDRSYDPVLRPAFGQLQVAADQPDAVVWIDGHHRGTAAGLIGEVCEGVHDVEVRAPAGTFAAKATIEYGKTTKIAAPLVPTFALLPAASGAPHDAELNTRLVDAFRTSSAVRLIVADPGTLGDVKSADAAAVAKRLSVQGTATATRIARDAEGNDVELTLTAAGAGRGDVVRLRADDGASVERVVKQLEATLPVSRRWIGLDVVDVLRVDGAVVSFVDPNGPANGVIKPGDVIVGVGPEPVASAPDLAGVLARAAGPAVNVRIRDRSDVVPVNLATQPAIVNASEPRLVFNEAVVELRARIARLRGDGSAADVAAADRLRLNLAVALMAVDGWTEAEALLGGIAAGPEHGIATGTLEYLRGMVAKAAGRSADARAHFERAAADPQAMLTEHGPLVAYLAKAELRVITQASR